MITLAGLASAALGFLTWVLRLLQQRHDEQVGAIAETVSLSAQGARTAASEAQAVVDSPSTPTAVQQALLAGKF